MASSKKRTATRELNHENWDNEEEKEDQGVFRQAGSEILQGRVIRKAKRRGVGSESGTGGTFAGFSGFKGTSHTSSSSGGLQGFDFLKGLKSSNGTTPSQETEGSKEPKGDEGSKEYKESKGDEASKEAKAPKAAVPLSELFKPKAGSWKCSVCDVSNESTSPQCVACTTPKPGGGTPSKPSVSSAKWTCESCMVPNAAEAEACVCCTTAKPGSSSSSNGTKSTFSFGAKPSSTPEGGGGGFKFGASASNGSTKPTEGFTFGSTGSGFKVSETKSESTFKFGSSEKPFSFGSSSPSTNPPATAPTGFKFTSSTSSASSSASNNTNTSTDGGFKINAAFKFEPSSAPSTPSGGKAGEAKTSGGGGATPKSDSRDKYAANLRALNRQLAKWVKAKVDENPNVLLSPIFTDYEKHLKSIAEKYPLTNSDTTPSADEKAPTINTSSSSSLLGAVFGNKDGNKTTSTDNKLVSFSTGSSSNSSGFGSFSSPKTTTKEPSPEKPKAEDKPNTEAKTGSSSNLFTFGSAAASKSTSGFSFGSSTSTTNSPSSGFTFGTGSKPTFGNIGSSSFFSGAAASVSASSSNDKAKDAAGGDAAEDEPPKVEVKTVEENDAKFSMRCKLYYKKEKDFIDRGVGMVHLKLLDENKKVQFLVRAETNLGNILLNIILNDKISFTQRGNNLQFVAVPNPSIKGIPEGPVSMLLKVKNAGMAEELHGKMKEILKEVS